MELNIVKNYLRIDFEEHDKLLELLISVAKEYIEDAIGKYDNTRKKQIILLCTLVSDMYANNYFSIDKNMQKNKIVSSIILQEQLRCEDEL